MSHKVVLAISMVALGLLAGAAPAEDPRQAERGTTLAEIRIGLPQGVEPNVVVSPGEGRITLELPRGSSFPLDFNAASAGLLKGGKVDSSGEGRVRLELQLASGRLDRIEYLPDSVVLHFSSRYGLTRASQNDDNQYMLGSEDKILITVHNHPELTSKLTVGKTGKITTPLVGDVTAAGLTVGQLAARLAELLDGDYLVTPQVDVQIEEYRSQWVMVAGEVRAPGRIQLRGGTDLKEVLTEAGGFSQTAGELITISREAGDAQAVNLVVDRAAFEQGGDNPKLIHGDIVTVQPMAYVYLDGEVRRPQKVPVERGMTLLKAISLAGGLTDWANEKEVRVLRHGEDGPGEEYNLKAIRRGRIPDPPLAGGEIIIVKRRFL